MAQDARQAGSKEALALRAASRPHGRAAVAGLGCLGRPAALPAHPAGSTLAPLPRTAKPGHSNITSQAPLLAPETHDTGLQTQGFLKW